MSAENQRLLSGSGSGGQMTGLFNVSRILTHNHSSDPSGWTALDAIGDSIVQMRTASGVLAAPDLLIVSPQVWGALRRLKSTTGEFLIRRDVDTAGALVREGEATGPTDNLWGIPTLVTTDVDPSNVGQASLIDTTKFGYAVIREGLTMRAGFSEDDFVRNLQRYVFETRLNITVVCPQCVLALSNLPTS